MTAYQQTVELLKIEFSRFLGINVLRFSKEKKKKNQIRVMLFAFIYLAILMIIYMTSMAVQLCNSGMGRVVPAYCMTVTSALVFLFSIFRAGNTLFNEKTYEKLAALPLKPGVIVWSRLLFLYGINLVMALLFMLPAGVVCGIRLELGAGYWIMFCIGTLFVPMIPVTAAAIIGALIASLSSRMEQKNIASAIFTLIFIMAIFLISMLPALNPSITDEMMMNIGTDMIGQVSVWYPVSMMFSEGVFGSAGSWIMFLLISIVVFSLFAWIIDKNYASICRRLTAHAARRKFVMSQQKSKTALRALYEMELRRYVSTPIYITNTIIGYLMMIIYSITMMLMIGNGQIPDGMIRTVLAQLTPVILGFMAMLASTTSSSISIEGRQWWIVRSLPVSPGLLFQAKVLLNLSLALPSCLLSAVLCALAFGWSGFVWYLIIPMALSVMTSFLGLAANLKFPSFDWDNATEIVKQGGNVLVAMASDFAVTGVGVLCWYLFSGFSYPVSMLIFLVLIAVVTGLLYRKVVNTDLRTIY
ncbi:MAG: hypothetical protein ACOYB8_09555 [Eubacteriaceae bacterium]|jgi:ABC-2 type transport system permease protein